jgi:transposase
MMIPGNTRVWLATGHTDMRRGFDGLTLLVQETLQLDPFGGHLFVFRGRRAHSTSFHIPFWVRAGRLCLASAARQTVAHRPAHDAGRG